jgi:hypothetical protein
MRFVTLAFMTLALAFAGQASIARNTFLQASNSTDGVVDRTVGSDHGILPGKAGVRAQADRLAPRSPPDQHPSPLAAGTSRPVPTSRPSGGASWDGYHESRPQRHGLVPFPRGPPSAEALNNGDGVLDSLVAALRSVDSVLLLRHDAPSRMMA